MTNLLNDKTKGLMNKVVAIIADGATDAIGIIGFILLCYGFGQIYPPLMYIAAGLFLMGIAFGASGSRSAKVQQVD